MCLSGAHYFIEDELEELPKKKKLVCSYSGLPSVESYMDDE